jgi:hypothetical protein
VTSPFKLIILLRPGILAKLEHLLRSCKKS